MADTFTTNVKVRLPQTGAYNNTWGSVLNADALNLLDDAITGQSAIVLSGTTYSLPALANGVDADSRSFCLRFTGAPGSTVTVTVPGTVTKKFYLVDNACGQSIIMTYSGSTTTATIANGEKRFVWCDGTNCFTPSAQASDATTLDGLDSTVFARRDVENIYQDRWSSPWVTVTEAPTTTIDASVGNHQKLTLTGNRVMAAPTNVVDGQPIVLMVIQDGTGSRTLTWNSVFVFESGLSPTLSPSPGAIDLFMMFYDSALTKWIVGHFGSIAAASGATYNVTITSNEIDVNLAARLGTVGSAATVNLTIAQGVVLQAGSTGSYALDCSSSLPSGSTLNLYNLGYVIGKGGRGGRGSGAHVSGSGNFGWNTGPTPGYPGGTAIRGPGSGVTFNVTNANGHIYAGGGGGGGGAGSITSNGGEAAGGGGGGGAGGSDGGDGGSVNELRAGQGIDGSSGVNGTFGAGGASTTAGGATAANGGAGGDWATAGTAAATDGAGATGGLGGAAGKAIELGGGSITFLSGSGSPNVEGIVS
jgi:hypothetical protein